MSNHTGRKHRPLAGLFVVALGASLPTMDLAVNVALPAITAAFSLETRAIRWVVVWYVLTYSSLMLAFGKLGDHIGHRRVFRAGLLVSVAAYLLCALAPAYHWLLVARFVQGIATALVLSCAPALATLLFDESKRTKALGIYSSAVAFASIVAPLIGGACIALLGWSGAFWFRAPLALLALALLRLLPAVQQPPAVSARRNFDHFSSMLLAAGIALLLLCPSLLGSDAPVWAALLPALVGTGALAAFARRQRRTPEKFLPPALVRDPEFVLLNLASIAAHFVAFAVPLLVPYHLTRIEGYSSFEGGAVLALSPAGMLLGSALAVPIARIAGARMTVVLGGLLVSTGGFAIGLWSSSATLLQILLSLLLHGVGLGLFQVAYTDVVVATLPRHARGVAGSLTMVTRTVGVVTAATALTSAVAVIEGSRLAAGETAVEAFAGAFGTVFLSCSGVLGAVFVVGWLQRRRRPST